MVTQTHVTVLPDEVLLQIFNMLPSTDLNKVMMVCRKWMSMTTIHGLYWVDISSIEPQLVSKVMSRLNYLPFHLMKLNLKQMEVLFTSIAQKESKLKKVECWPCKEWFQSDMAKLSPALFVAAVINVEEFDIGAQPDLQPHMQALMEAISEGQTHLKKLNFYSNSILISIEPVTLGSAINSMEFVRIYQGEPEAQGGLGFQMIIIRPSFNLLD